VIIRKKKIDEELQPNFKERSKLIKQKHVMQMIPQRSPINAQIKLYIIYLSIILAKTEYTLREGTQLNDWSRY
jgi:hypothetical protein